MLPWLYIIARHSMSHKLVTCRSYGMCVIIHNNRKEQRAGVSLPRGHIALPTDVTVTLSHKLT